MKEKVKTMKKTDIFDTLKSKALEVIQELKEAILGKPQKSATPSPQKKPQTEPYVFITVKGKKFHYDPNCSSLHGAKTYKMDLSKAKKASYKACDKCCYSYLHD